MYRAEYPGRCGRRKSSLVNLSSPTTVSKLTSPIADLPSPRSPINPAIVLDLENSLSLPNGPSRPLLRFFPKCVSRMAISPSNLS